MNGRGFIAGAAICLILLVNAAHAQIDYRPTPAPLVTAELEPWYLAGEPVMHVGAIYYPAGPQIHFMPFEMVRSGFFQGIPLYVRTTLEPNSVVFVPVGRGLMQPYERRRDGDLAGTVGSRAPSFPVARTPDEPAGVVQAPAPPTRAPVYVPDMPASALGLDWPEPVATTGAAPAVVRPAARGRQPGPADGIFIEFDGARWFSEGVQPRLDRSALTRHGEHRGAPVYVRLGDTAIYVPVNRDPDAPLARYVRR
jgi:hypothetical protein